MTWYHKIGAGMLGAPIALVLLGVVVMAFVAATQLMLVFTALGLWYAVGLYLFHKG